MITAEEKARRMLAVLEHRLISARHHPIPFVDFVMKEETSQAQLRAAAHQRVLLKFAYDHPRCCIMLPVGHSKTFSMGALAMFELGKDPTSRGAIVSATQGQAAKPLGMVSAYIETSPELRLVFPNLKPSLRRADPWTTTAITVQRPAGIRDPSLIAVGIEGAIVGARLKFIVVDDILTHENTSNREAREKVFQWFDSSVLSRIDPRPDARIIVTNTAWHPDDMMHRLKARGWPTLRMEVEGIISIYNADDWDCAELRPASPNSDDCRLACIDDDTPLWSEKYSVERIAGIKRDHLPQRYNQLYKNICRDDNSARCKEEWIETCKRKAVEHGIHNFLHEYRGPNITFTGIDLAVQPGEEHDDVAFFTYEQLPSGHRRILNIEIGQFDGPTIINMLFDAHARYNSILRVENNGAQDFIRQFALDRDVSLPIKAHTTGRAKAHPEHGVEGLFVELSNGVWLIPCSPSGEMPPNAKRFADACLNYSPTKHTDDVLMACYFAREQGKAFGLGNKKQGSNGNGLASLLMR